MIKEDNSKLNLHHAATVDNDASALERSLLGISQPLDEYIEDTKNIEKLLETREYFRSLAGSRLSEKLIELLDQVNSQDDKGNTPLHKAVESGKYNSVLLLLAIGADINVKNNQGQKAVDLAVGSSFTHTILEFISNTDEFENQELEVLEEKCVNLFLEKLSKLTVERLEEENSEILWMGFISKSNIILPLHVAILNDVDPKKIGWLIAQKWSDINECDEEGNSALHLAVDKGLIAITQLLIEFGADINLKGNDDRTPLLIATHAGLTDMTKLLVKLGAENTKQSQTKALPLSPLPENEPSSFFGLPIVPISVIQDQLKTLEREREARLKGNLGCDNHWNEKVL